MKILLIEPYFTGSHRQWALDFQRFSSHDVEILSLPGIHWKWRMHGGAVELAMRISDKEVDADCIVASDMLDVATFKALAGNKVKNTPIAVYFHENQMTYPWSDISEDKRKGWDRHYAFINYTSALASERVLFNSEYHRKVFIEQLPSFLEVFPDFKGLENVVTISEKSEVLYPGVDLKKMDEFRQNRTGNRPLIIWNHRWEYDKNPEDFFHCLFDLKEEGMHFDLAVLGESYSKAPSVFAQANEKLRDNIMHWGFVDSREEYFSWLDKGDLLPVSSKQDFFGISVVEAIYMGCIPLLPNRLAFPEHIPAELHEKCLYEGYRELKDKLKNCLLKPENPEVRDLLKSRVSGYDWSMIIEKYDRALENLVLNY